ncbi:MAG: hypothetical protein ACXVPL_03750 [Actinomycetota bacterium]
MIDRTAAAAPALADEELHARVDRLQSMMAEHGFAALVCYGAHRDWVPADIWYLARWSCIDEEMSYVVVPRADRRASSRMRSGISNGRRTRRSPAGCCSIASRALSSGRSCVS